MKCVRCSRDSKLSERPGRRCPGCGGTFAFEPREGDKVTDALFADAIARVSSSGEVWWGVEHLYYEVARRLHKRRTKSRAPLLVIGGVVALVVSVAVHWMVGVIMMIVLGVPALYAATRKEIVLSREDFEKLWTRWKEVHEAPRRLITRRKPEALPAARTLDPDIPSYSFDRAVVCDRARTVDLLLTNNFHFENNCAVLSVDGYPHHAFEVVRTMLKNNPRLQVYALHDATPEGCALAARVARDPQWFDGRVQVVDVGLRPAHARAFRGLWTRRSMAQVDRLATATLAESEREWLESGWVMELAAIAPEQVIKRLYRALAHDRAGDGGSGGGGSGTDSGSGDGMVVVYTDGPGLHVDASASDGGGDSFG